MFQFEYHLNDLFEYADLLSAQEGFTRNGHHITYPEQIAKGGSSFFWINDYMSVQLVNYVAQTRMSFERLPNQHQHIVINFQDFTFCACKDHHTCNEIVASNEGIGSVQCKSTRIEEKVVIEPGMQVRLALVLLKEGWVDKVLHDQVNKEKFYAYLVSSDANIRKEYLTVEQRKLLFELLSPSQKTKIEILYNESRIFGLLETFLTEILVKDEQLITPFSSSREDIDKIRQAESFIMDNILEPFPGVNFLARICCMSRTKFIGLFNEVYGMSSYDYYQKERLKMAYGYIVSGHYEPGEVARKVGYRSSNGFVTAFKKEYGVFPKELANSFRNN
jgi:AraC-like DNA-binding protein/predicted DNA-binding protein (MmcQ/YjbR family)